MARKQNILIDTDPNKILDDIQKEVSKKSFSVEQNERLREILASITKEFEDQNNLLKKQQEYRNADLSTKSQILKSDLESLKLMQHTVSVLEDRIKKQGKLSEEEQAYYDEAKKREKEFQDGIAYREDLLRNQQKWYDEALKKNSTLLQRTERLKDRLKSARNESSKLEEARLQEQVRHDMMMKDLELQHKNGLISDESFQERSETENEAFEDTMSDIGKQLDHLKFLGTISSVLGVVSKTLGRISSSVDKGIDQAASDRREYQGRVTARLQGLADIDFEKIVSDAASEYQNSAFVTQSKFLQSVDKLTTQGIAYNLENRALLETISDKLVSTFDTLEPTLLRLTRIQQSDLSVSQLGAEAQLTQFLNSMFKDTSYLNQTYDSINSTLMDVAALMNFDEATSFMYSVQKWLGSLYSLGVSDQGVQTIAQGLSYLGSGNVSSLSSNSPLQTLIVQSLTRAGYNYADVLSNGLTTQTTNDLLKAMVENLQDISNNTSSKVLKSAWGNIIGLNTTDLQAIRNLQKSDLVAISNSTINYESAIKQANDQLGQLGSRTYISEQLDNFLNNTFYTIGSKLATDNSAYLTYSLSKNLESMFGDSLLSQIAFGAAKVGSLAHAFGAETTTKEQGGFIGKITSYFKDTAVGSVIDTVQRVLDGIGNFITFAGDTVTQGVDLIQGQADLPSWLNFQQFTSRGDMMLSSPDFLEKSLGQVSSQMYTVPQSSGVNTGISYSGAYGVQGDISTMFEDNEKLLSASYETRSDYTRTITRSASDIYHELFEAQSTPIRIKLAEIESLAMDQLKLSTGGYYPVDVKDEDIDAVGNVLRQLPIVRIDG